MRGYSGNIFHTYIVKNHAKDPWNHPCQHKSLCNHSLHTFRKLCTFEARYRVITRRPSYAPHLLLRPGSPHCRSDKVPTIKGLRRSTLSPTRLPHLERDRHSQICLPVGVPHSTHSSTGACNIHGRQSPHRLNSILTSSNPPNYFPSQWVPQIYLRQNPLITVPRAVAASTCL